MKRILVILLLALALHSLVSGQTITDGKSQDVKGQQAVLLVLKAWAAALASNDLAAIQQIVAEDYVITTSDGQVLNREQDLAPLKSGEIKFESAATEDVKVHMFGKTAVVTGIGLFKVRYQGRLIDSRERFTDVYQKRKGRWQPIASHSSRIPQSRR